MNALINEEESADVEEITRQQSVGRVYILLVSIGSFSPFCSSFFNFVSACLLKVVDGLDY